MNLIINKSLNWKRDFAIALSFLAVPLGMYLNYFFDKKIFSELLLIIGLFFIFDFKRILNFKIINLGYFVGLIFLFQVISIFYLIYADEYRFFPMHLYLIFLILALAFCDLNKISVEYIIKYMFILSSLCVFLGGYFVYNGLVVGYEAWEIRQENPEYALEIFTITSAAVINFSICIYYISKNQIKLFCVFMIFLTLYIVVFGGKRSPFILLISTILFWMFFLKNKIKFNLIGYSVFGAFLMSIIIASNQSMRDYLFKIIDNSLLGIKILLGQSGVVDHTGSALIRVENREWALNLISEKFELIHIIFGYGYMTRWLDNPILQSFLDMGIIGLFIYLIVVIIAPCYKFFISSKSAIIILFFTFCLPAIVTCFNSGNPYMYKKFIPVILFLFILKVITVSRSK